MSFLISPNDIPIGLNLFEKIKNILKMYLEANIIKNKALSKRQNMAE